MEAPLRQLAEEALRQRADEPLRRHQVGRPVPVVSAVTPTRQFLSTALETSDAKSVVAEMHANAPVAWKRASWFSSLRLVS